MKLAIMQPYFFPYLGYWQLISAVDRFVIYDDVNYIKGGWINRNRILINGAPSYITAPIHAASSFKPIRELRLDRTQPWRDKILKSIENSYRRSPAFQDVFPVIESIVRNEDDRLSHYLTTGIKTISQLLNIKTDILETSSRYNNGQLKGEDRVIDICHAEKASLYINPEGGQKLYSQVRFNQSGIALQFLVMAVTPYPQRTAPFIPYLSIIDLLMELGTAGTASYLNDFSLSCP